MSSLAIVTLDSNNDSGEPSGVIPRTPADSGKVRWLTPSGSPGRLVTGEWLRNHSASATLVTKHQLGAEVSNSFQGN